MNEKEFLENYNMRDYPPVAVTVDVAVFTIRDGALSLLLVKRGEHPERGKWALPGGFVNHGESLDETASRELSEEVGIELPYLEQLKTYGNPVRDARGFVVTVVYVALVPNVDSLRAGSDAADARFFDVDDVLDPSFTLAFDHDVIIADGLERVRAKIEYAPVAHNFLSSSEFTLTELRKVYETVWGQELTPSNFRRKVLSVPGLVVGVNKKSNETNGRPSDLYTAGDASVIHPPIQQP